MTTSGGVERVTKQIAQPDWLNSAMPSIEDSFHLYRTNKIPACIERFMIVTPLKHALRGIYGRGNIGVALCLLREGIAEYLKHSYWDIRFRLGLDKDAEDMLEGN